MDEIGVKVDEGSADGIDKIVSAIDRLHAALDGLGSSSTGSSLRALESQMQVMQASMNNGFAEMSALAQKSGAETVRQIEANGNAAAKAMEAAGQKLLQADAATWQQIQNGASGNVAKAFNQLAQGIPVEAVTARLGELATTTAASMNGELEQLKQFQANTKSLWQTHYDALAGATEAELGQAYAMNEVFNARAVAQAAAAADKLLSIEIASENARASVLQSLIEKRDMWTAEENARQEAAAMSAADKLLSIEIASENARAANLQAMIEKRDLILAESRAKELADSAAALAKQNALNRSFALQSPTQQINTIKTGVVAGAQGEDVAALIGTTAAAKAATTSLAELEAVQAMLPVSARAATVAEVEQAMSLRDLEGVYKGAAHEMGIFGLAHGQLVAMMAGAGLATILHGIAVGGAEVEYQLAFLTAFSQNAKPIDIGKFIDISSGSLSNIHDAAEGMKALAEAGFGEQQALSALPDLLKLSALGAMDVATAAELAVESMHAFGKESTDLGGIVDILTSVSSKSNVSVKTLGEGLKSAATTGQMFGMSIQEVTATVAVLEQRGLTISPLASALTNLYEPSKKVQAAMDAMGFSARDATGNLKPVQTVITDLAATLSTLKTPADFLTQIAPPRSVKALQAMTSNLQGYKEELDAATNSSGFALQATIALQDTVEGAAKQLQNIVQGDFQKAFADASPIIRQVETDLQNIAKDPSTISFLSGLITAFARLTDLLVTHAGAITLVVGAYLGLKVISSLTATLAEYVIAQEAAAAAATLTAERNAILATTTGLVTVESGAATIALEVEAGAATLTGEALTVAATGAKLFTSSLGVIGLAITALTVIYELLHSGMDTHEKDRLTALNSADTLVSAYDAETKHLKDLQDQMLLTGEAGAESALKVQRAALQMQQSAVQSALEVAKAQQASQVGGVDPNNPNENAHDTNSLVQNLQTQLAAIEQRMSAIDTSVSAHAVQAKATQDTSNIEALKKRIEGLTAAAGLDTANGGTSGTRALASEITGIQQLSVTTENYAGVLATVNAEYDKIKAQKNDVPKATKDTGANDRLNALLNEIALKKQLFDVEQKTSLLSLKQDNTTGVLGNSGYADAQAAASKAAVQMGIDQAKADIDAVRGTENKLAAIQKYKNAVTVGAQQIQEIDLQDQVAQYGVFQKYQDLATQYQAKALGDQGSAKDAFLANFKSTYSTVMAGAVDDMVNGSSEGIRKAAANALVALDSLKKAGSDKAVAADLEKGFSSSLAQVSVDVDTLIKKSTSSSGLSAIFSHAMQAEEAYTAGIQNAINKQKQLEALGASTGNPAIQKQAATDLQKLNSESAKMQTIWVDVGKSIGQSLTSAFGAGGTALAGLLDATIAYGVKRQQIDQDYASSDTSSPDKLAKAQTAASNDMASAQVKAYGDMAGAAQGFFSKGSDGYKALGKAEQVYRVAELAMSAEAMVAKLFETTTVTAAKLTGLDLEVAGEVGSVPIVAAAEGAKSTAYGITALAASLAIPPPFSFIAFAAVAALLLSIGVAVASGGSSGPTVAQQNQAAAGTGSVLGDPNAKSNSIADSLTNIEKSSGLGLVHSASMDTSLKQIVAGISGLSTILVNTTGVTGAIPGVTTGTPSFLGTLLGGSSVSVTDQGIQAAPTTLGSVQSNGMSLSSYADVHSSSWWGLSSSDTTQTTQLSQATDNQFSMIITNLAKTITDAATTLGAGGDAFTQHLQTFVVDIGQISTQGLTGTQIQTELNNVFSKVGDDMASFALGSLTQFAQVGEGALATLTRVANDYIQVSDVMATLGESFNVTGIAAATLSEGLISAAGDLTTLTTNTGYFVTNFLSSAQQIAPVIDSVNAALANLGVTGVTTNQQFTDLVLAQNLNTTAGQEMYAALIAIAPQFKAMTDYTASLSGVTATTPSNILSEQTSLQGQLNTLTMSAVQLMEKQRDAISASNQALFDQVEVLTAAADVTTKSTSLVSAYTTAAQAQQSVIDGLKQFQQSLLDLKSSLQIGTLSTLTPEQQLAQTKAAYTAALSATQADMTAAQGGDATAQARLSTDQGTLSSTAQAYLTADRSYNASNPTYAADALKVQNDLTKLASGAQTQVDTAQAQLNAMTAEVSQLVTLNATTDQVLSAIMDLVSSLQVSAAAQNNVSPGSGAATTAQATAAESSVVTSLYSSLLGRTPDQGGLSYWTGLMSQGETLAQITAGIQNSPEYQALHNPHAAGGVTSGWSLVGEKGPEMINVGSASRVYTAAQTAGMFSGGSGGQSMSAADAAKMTALLQQIVEGQKAGLNQNSAISAADQAAAQALLKAQRATKLAISRQPVGMK